MGNKLGLSIQPQYINGNMEMLGKELLRVERAGADCCELVLHGLDVVAGGRLVPTRVKTVLGLLRGHRLEYTLHLPYDLNMLELDTLRIYTDVFKAGIEFAHMADIRVIVFHAGTAKRYNGDIFRAEAESVSRLAREAKGIALCMENPVILSDDVYSAGKSTDNMIEFCNWVNAPNCKLTFDVGHYYLRCKGDKAELPAAIAKAKPHIGHIHLHDNFGLALPMTEHDCSHRIVCGAADLHLPLGWGTIPVGEVMAALSGYDGIINLEIEKRFDDQYESSLKIVRQHLDNL
jgi:sugar phosphate isomerase/epimerase